jgi:hypothetical protein
MLAVQPTRQVNVLGVGVHAVDMHSAALILETLIRERTKGYVCRLDGASEGFSCDA